MESGPKQRLSNGARTVYRIVVREEISEGLATTAFEGMQMEIRGGQTILTGEVDQPHIHGILDRIGALGLKLVSVESVPARDQQGGLR